MLFSVLLWKAFLMGSLEEHGLRSWRYQKSRCQSTHYKSTSIQLCKILGSFSVIPRISYPLTLFSMVNSGFSQLTWKYLGPFLVAWVDTSTSLLTVPVMRNLVYLKTVSFLACLILYTYIFSRILLIRISKILPFFGGVKFFHLKSNIKVLV